jgi:pimeloyl-ACP methyl ester carboxylesterase
VTDLPTPRRVSIPEREGPRGSTIPAITLSVHEAGEGPAVVLCHGFPELAFSWRHQVRALAEAGFRVIAPDQRGYGASDSPEGIASFDLEHLTSDLAGLLDALEIDRAFFAGHDWGGFVAWGMPIAYPERTAGVIGVNTPYVPFPDTATLRLAFDDDAKLYILWFQEPGVAEAVLDRNPRLVFEKLMRRGRPLEQAAGLTAMQDANPFRRLDSFDPPGDPLLDDDELDTYARAFEKSGFRGGVSWYRNIDRNKQLFPEIGTHKLELPCLMITAEWDGALRPEMAAGMPALCSDLETHLIAECGHWTQQEKPAELDRLMIDWLRRRL